MRIQVSPWETTKTSFRTQRRKKTTLPQSPNENKLNGTSSKYSTRELEYSVPFTALFIEAGSGSKKHTLPKQRDRGSESSLAPTLLVATDHRISLIGTSSSGTICENNSIQFTSHPSESTSFRPNKIDTDSKAHHHGNTTNGRNITSTNPLGTHSVYDSDRQHLYAFQRNNTKLICMKGISSTSSPLNEIVADATLRNSANGLCQLNLSPAKRQEDSVLLIGSDCYGRTFFVHHSLSTITSEIKQQPENKLRIEYVNHESTSLKNEKYIGCFHYVKPPAQNNVQLANIQKRKRMNEYSERSSSNTVSATANVIVCKVYLLGADVMISKQEFVFNIKTNELRKEDSDSQPEICTISLLSNVEFDQETDVANSFIENAEVLGFVDRHHVLVLSFSTRIGVASRTTTSATTTKSKGHNANGSMHSNISTKFENESDCSTDANVCNKKYFVSISLRTGQLCGIPVKLPLNTKKICLTASLFVTVQTTNNTILFFDTIRGSRMYSVSFEQILNVNGGNDSYDEIGMDSITLITDNKKPRIAVLYVADDTLHIGFASLFIESLSADRSPVPKKLSQIGSKRISLAAGLGSCYARKSNTHQLLEQNHQNRNRNIVKLNPKRDGEVARAIEVCATEQEDSIVHAINLLTEAMHLGSQKAYRNGSHSTKSSLGLLDAFDKAVTLANEKKILSTNDSRKALDNNCTITESGQYNLNHTPQPFVDTVCDLIIKYLFASNSSYGQAHHSLSNINTTRDGCQVILQRLIHHGKISSRYHFQRIPDAALFDRKKPTNSLSAIGLLLQVFDSIDAETSRANERSPTTFIFDIVENCSDVTERQMVSFFRYMISKAQPIEIAAYFELNRIRLQQQGYYNVTKVDRQDPTSKKFILVGLSYLVKKIASLADPNECFLRSAIANELSTEEVKLLLHAFGKYVNLLTQQVQYSNDRSVSRSLTWISALSSVQRNVVAVSSIQTALSSVIAGMEDLWTMFEQKRARNMATLTTSKKRPYNEIENLVVDDSISKKSRRDAKAIQLGNEPDSCAYQIELL